MTTDKTIKSKYQPKQTNVTWVDLSGETPVEKHFINGRWVEIGGGSKGSGSGCNCGGFKYNELPEPTVVRELTEEDLGKLPSSDYIPHNSSYGDVIDLDNGIIPDKLILQNNSEYNIMYLSGIDTGGGGAENVIWVYYDSIMDSIMYVVSADGSIMVSLKPDGEVVG